MKTGDIILIPFPFAELINIKIRPAIVICQTKDSYKDLVVCSISSVVPNIIGQNELLLQTDKSNNLRVTSVAKIDRIVTVKQNSIINQLGKLNTKNLGEFCDIFRNLID